MLAYNLTAVWIGLLLGMLTGAILGLFFHQQEWLGGYDSWRRRLLRLGHISFFGLAIANLAFVDTVHGLKIAPASGEGAIFWPSVLFLAGMVLMPLICFLSAWQKPLRHFFFLPVASLLIATIWTLTLCLQAG